MKVLLQKALNDKNARCEQQRVTQFLGKYS